MPSREFYYPWEWDLRCSPKALWPLVADTNRFNRDTGLPPVQKSSAGANARRCLRFTKLGLVVEWEEEPCEWVRPRRFGVVRRYKQGTVAQMRVLAELEPRARAGDSAVVLGVTLAGQPAGMAGHPGAGGNTERPQLCPGLPPVRRVGLPRRGPLAVALGPAASALCRGRQATAPGPAADLAGRGGGPGPGPARSPGGPPRTSRRFEHRLHPALRAGRCLGRAAEPCAGVVPALHPGGLA